MAKELIIYAPVTGTVIELKNLKDEVFKMEMVGKGAAIIPEADGGSNIATFYSPIAKGKIGMIFETKHAIGFKAKNFELLLHVGMDTVELAGKGFTSKVTQGSKVMVNPKKNIKTPILEVDLALLKKAKKIFDSPIVVTNESLKDAWKVELIAKDKQKVVAGEPLYKLVKA